jgi:transcriptional regulator with XRE-family HTH domain
MPQAAQPASSDFASWLRTRRAEVGLSRRALADLVGRREEAIEHWELGDHLPQRRNEAALANALQVPADALATRLGRSAQDNRARVVALRLEPAPAADTDGPIRAEQAATQFIAIFLDRWAAGEAMAPEVVTLVARRLFKDG